MPTIAFKTRTRTVSENCGLDLVVQHRLVAGESSETLLVKNRAPPKIIDIVLVSPLTITISGTLNGRRPLAEHLKSSGMAQHLPEYLRRNSKELGIEVVSDPYIAEDTGLLTFFCTACWPTRSTDIQDHHLKLLGFDLDYIWQESSSSSFSESQVLDATLTPFSRQLPLPYLAALSNVVERFAFQITRRYPCVFGTWRQQLDAEQDLISSLYTSLRNILNRSSNLSFRVSFENRMKLLRTSFSSSLDSSEDALSNYLGIDVKNTQFAPHDDQLAFIFAMERVYRVAMKRQTFKGVPSRTQAHCIDDTIYDQQTWADHNVDFNEELYTVGPEEDECFPLYEGPDVCDVLFPDFSSDPGYVDLDSDQSLVSPDDRLCDRFANHISCDVFDESFGLPLPEESSMAYLRPATCLNLDQVTRTVSSNSDVIYCEDESLVSFDGDRSLDVDSPLNADVASADIASFLGDVDIFEVEAPELQSPACSGLSPTCSSPSVGTRTAVSVFELSYEASLTSDEDRTKGNQAISEFSIDISAESCCGPDFTHDISGFGFTGMDDFYDEDAALSSLGDACETGISIVKEPCFPRGGLSTISSSLSGLGYELECSDTLYSPFDMDFVAMDFGL